MLETTNKTLGWQNKLQVISINISLKGSAPPVILSSKDLLKLVNSFTSGTWWTRWLRQMIGDQPGEGVTGPLHFLNRAVESNPWPNPPKWRSPHHHNGQSTVVASGPYRSSQQVQFYLPYERTHTDLSHIYFVYHGVRFWAGRALQINRIEVPDLTLHSKDDFAKRKNVVQNSSKYFLFSSYWQFFPSYATSPSQIDHIVFLKAFSTLGPLPQQRQNKDYIWQLTFYGEEFLRINSRRP